MAEEGIDLLWTTRNAFYVGAHQAAIAEAADLDGLGPADKLERDVFVYRAYVELGSYEVCMRVTGLGLARRHRRARRWEEFFFFLFFPSRVRALGESAALFASPARGVAASRRLQLTHGPASHYIATFLRHASRPHPSPGATTAKRTRTPDPLARPHSSIFPSLLII